MQTSAYRSAQSPARAGTGYIGSVRTTTKRQASEEGSREAGLTIIDLACIGPVMPKLDDMQATHRGRQTQPGLHYPVQTVRNRLLEVSYD